MGKRTRTKHGAGKNMYLQRGKKGKFKEWTSIPQSIKADGNINAKNVSKPGYGHLGDLATKAKRKVV